MNYRILFDNFFTFKKKQAIEQLIQSPNHSHLPNRINILSTLLRELHPFNNPMQQFFFFCIISAYFGQFGQHVVDNDF